MGIVQSTSVQRTAVTTTTLAYTSNLAAGNLAVVDYAIYTQSLSSMTWSVGGSATPSAAQETNDGVNLIRVGIRYSANTASGAHTVSVTLSSSGDVTLAVHEYDTILTASPLDVTATHTTPSSSNTTPTTNASSTLAQAANTVHVAMSHDGSSSQSITAGSGYTIRQTQTTTTAMPIGTEDQHVNSTSAVTGTFTIGAAAHWVVALAVFKETTAGGSTPPLRRRAMRWFRQAK